MDEIKKLHEKRAKLIADLQTYAKDNRDDWTTENEEQWVARNADIDSLKKDIDRLHRMHELEKEAADNPFAEGTGHTSSENRDGDRLDGGSKDVEEQAAERRARPNQSDDKFDGKGLSPFGSKEERAILNAWFRHQKGVELAPEQVEICQRYGVNPARPTIDLALPGQDEYRQIRRKWWQERALTVSATSGGELIPEGFVSEWEKALLDFTDIRPFCTVRRTASGNDLPQPFSDDTANKGAILAINTTVGEQDIATGELVLNAFKYTSKMIKVPVELLEDSAFSLPTELGQMLGERIGRILSEHFTTGDGTGKPKGVVVAAADSTVTTASATAVTYTELATFMHKVDRAYRRSPSAAWMFHDSSLLKVRLLQDGAGGFIFSQGAAGEPDRLLNHPIIINNEMAEVATTAKAWIFGDFSKYIIRDVAAVRLRRLTERFADDDQEAFVAFSRHDGDLLNAGGDPIKWMDHA